MVEDVHKETSSFLSHYICSLYVLYNNIYSCYILKKLKVRTKPSHLYTNTVPGFIDFRCVKCGMGNPESCKCSFGLSIICQHAKSNFLFILSFPVRSYLTEHQQQPSQPVFTRQFSCEKVDLSKETWNLDELKYWGLGDPQLLTGKHSPLSFL